MIKQILLTGSIIMLVSCGKGEPIYMAGKLAEKIAQTPRNVAREVVGYGRAKNGNDGSNCYAEQASEGLNIICGDTKEYIPDGKDGDDGDFLGYLELRTVCEDVAGSYKETLLYLDGQYLSYYATNKWKKQRLVILKENTTYKTSDGRNVLFKVENGEIICL